MDDLNDLALFSAVVSHGSFSQAARALGVTKSLISRRVEALEQQLGVRLLQRSTRAVAVTEIGHAMVQHCESMLEASRAAYDVAKHARSRPAGRLRISCPTAVGGFFLAPLLPLFMRQYPDVRMEFDLTNRQVDVIREGYDIAFRVRSSMADSSFIIRDFGASEQVLVASPEFMNEHGPFDTLDSLAGIRAVGKLTAGQGKGTWRLIRPDNQRVEVLYQPIFETDDVFLLTRIAMSGIAAAQVPFNVCESALDSGKLRLLAPAYPMHAPRLFAVLPSRLHMATSARAFLNFLSVYLIEETSRASKKLRALRPHFDGSH
ncbi:LysR substrate-binding domain-containing protein [Burkholderia plantarii]|uniref:LysR substrate-binding domain-containing protein n=1 Tax=Burkholderia plantarii TaxID=41899 RepID=UPI0018DDF1E3|nr:LysR substrate-binding domain-containing protein [Burkholderia plantarii]MBI0331779.1 LysR family transcriptional regulator [Burkholderia plantarii]